MTLREEHKLNVVENQVLRRAFGLRRKYIRGDGRRMFTEKIRGNIIKKVEKKGSSGTHEGEERCIQGFRGEN